MLPFTSQPRVAADAATLGFGLQLLQGWQFTKAGKFELPNERFSLIFQVAFTTETQRRWPRFSVASVPLWFILPLWFIPLPIFQFALVHTPGSQLFAARRLGS